MYAENRVCRFGQIVHCLFSRITQVRDTDKVSKYHDYRNLTIHFCKHYADTITLTLRIVTLRPVINLRINLFTPDPGQIGDRIIVV